MKDTSTSLSTRITVFYITTPNKDSASQLGHLAVDQKLAGCANIFPIQSIFPWEDCIQHEEEFVLILKTIPSLKEKLRAFVSEHHPYEVPCIISWDVEVNDKYAEWIESNVLNSEQTNTSTLSTSKE